MGTFANSEDPDKMQHSAPDKMQHSAAFYLGLQCLLKIETTFISPFL